MPLFAGTDLESHLRQFEGRWAGDFVLSSPQTGNEERFPVEQSYWWDDGVLRGISVFERNGEMGSASSRSYVVGDRLVSEVEREGKIERYIGIRTESGVIWVPAATGRLTEHQVKESIVREGAVRYLLTEGFDTYVVEGRATQLIYRGKLLSVPE